MPDKKPPAKPAKKVDVVLLKDHTHAGTPYKKGATLQVSETLLPWLRAQKLIAEESK